MKGRAHPAFAEDDMARLIILDPCGGSQLAEIFGVQFRKQRSLLQQFTSFHGTAFPLEKTNEAIDLRIAVVVQFEFGLRVTV